MKLSNKVSLALITLLTRITLADVFMYQLNGVPRESSACHDQVNAVAESFESRVHVKVLHVECKTEHETGCDFNIEYESPQQIEFTSTDYKKVPFFFKARYADRDVCLSHLEQQKALFQEATGLSPIFSYCVDYSYGTKPWGINLTAVGTSALKPQIGSYIAISEPKDSQTSELVENLKSALKQKGAIFSDWVYQTATMLGEVFIHYYATEPLQFSLNKVSSISSLEICANQAQEAKSWLMPLSNPPFTVHCQTSRVGRFELYVGWIGDSKVVNSYSAESFSKFEECENQKAHTISHYQGSSIYQLLGGLCSLNLDNHKYQVVLFKVKK